MKLLHGLAIAAVLVACKDEKKSEVVLAPSASALAPSTTSMSAASMKFTVTKGKTTIDMPAPSEHIKAETSDASGDLQVDLSKLGETRGLVKVDVSKLSTKTFDDSKKNESQTEHARTWLEASDKLPEDVRTKNKYAEFAIRSVSDLSATDLAKVAAKTEGAEDVRTVTLTAKGEFLIHGRKVDREVKLEAAFHYPKGAAADAKPTSVIVKTREPMKVVLAEHDIKPRDDGGKIAQKAFNILGVKVADVASVSLEIQASP